VLYKRAIALAPRTDNYYMALGRVFTQKSNSTKNSPTSYFNDQTGLKQVLELDARQTAALGRVDSLYASEMMLLQARDLNPLYVDHTLNLARFFKPELPVDTRTNGIGSVKADGYYAQQAGSIPTTCCVE